MLEVPSPPLADLSAVSRHRVADVFQNVQKVKSKCIGVSISPVTDALINARWT